MEGQLRSEAEKSWLPGSPVGDRPLSRRAYDAIFTAIQDGQLAPGSLVREADLTTWLEMSRTPLRDALQRLEAEGLLSMQSHRGIRIAALDQQQVSELYTAREWAEGAAASLAARHATPVDIARMRHILEKERASAADPVAGARLNRDLHLTIHTCARNRYLAEHLSSMAALLALVGNTRRRNANRVLEAEQEHAALVAAIADGDSQRAEASARQHIQAAQRNVLTHWVGA